MSKSAFSAKVFAIYLFILGVLLVFVPNLLLSLFRVPETSEVWIRVVGVTVFVIGVFAWVAARHELKPFLVASVYTRVAVFATFTTFAVVGLASPMLILFGAVDLAGGMWTHFALRADTQNG